MRDDRHGIPVRLPGHLSCVDLLKTHPCVMQEAYDPGTSVATIYFLRCADHFNFYFQLPYHITHFHFHIESPAFFSFQHI